MERGLVYEEKGLCTRREEDLCMRRRRACVTYVVRMAVSSLQVFNQQKRIGREETRASLLALYLFK